MHTYARGCTCIGQNLKVLWGIIRWSQVGKQSGIQAKKVYCLLLPSGVLSSLSCVADGIALRLRGLDSSRSSTPKTKVLSACKSLAREYCRLSSLLFAGALAARSVDRRLYSQARKSRQLRMLAKSNSLSQRLTLVPITPNLT